MAEEEKQRCQICGKTFSVDELFPGELVRPALVEEIRKGKKDWDEGGYICCDDLHHFQTKRIQGILTQEKGALSQLEKEVVESFAEREILTETLHREFDTQRSFGERLADAVTEFIGSWKFIVVFCAVFATWLMINVVLLTSRPFDPYPFILLNLVLSSLAAIQAPIILMSQNRQNQKDRLRADHEYGINLKAELQIRQLHGKMDLLMKRQWARLLEVHRSQVDLLELLSDHTAEKRRRR